MSLRKQVAEMSIARAKALGLKGKARDRDAIAFACGAAAAAAFISGAKSSKYCELSMLAFLVAARGYNELELAAKS